MQYVFVWLVFSFIDRRRTRCKNQVTSALAVAEMLVAQSKPTSCRVMLEEGGSGFKNTYSDSKKKNSCGVRCFSANAPRLKKACFLPVLPSLVWLLSAVPVALLDEVRKANKLPLASEWRDAAGRGNEYAGSF